MNLELNYLAQDSRYDKTLYKIITAGLGNVIIFIAALASKRVSSKFKKLYYINNDFTL